MRLQRDVLVEIEERKVLLKTLQINRGEFRDFGWVRLRVDGAVKVRLIGVWANESKEIWWLATNLKSSVAEIVGLYDRRMSIEEQFRDTKGARFGLKLKWTQFEKGEYLERMYLLVGLAMLLFGANLFVDGAVAVAERFGVSQAVIGLTIVAVGTSLPELATSIVAAFKGEGDIAVGNAVGSSIFNILCILGVAALIRPMATTGISMVDLAVMTACAVLVMPIMRSGFCLNRWEGIFLLAVYVGYLYYVIP